jgi:hypothetical protein
MRQGKKAGQGAREAEGQGKKARQEGVKEQRGEVQKKTMHDMQVDEGGAGKTSG